MDDYTCRACCDTGLDSRGGICLPCLKHERQPLFDAMKRTIGAIFREAWEGQRVPTAFEVQRGVDHVYRPRCTYAAGYRQDDGSVAMVAGPTQYMKDLLEFGGVDTDERPLIIVEFIRGEYGEEYAERSVAKYVDGAWVFRKKT